MHAGGGIVTAIMSEVTSQLQAEFCKHAEPAKQKNLLSVIALSVKSTNLKPYHMALLKVTILQYCKLSKLEIYHMASLDLLILQKLEIQQNWNSPHGISRIADSTKTGNLTNLKLHHMASLDLLFCKTGNQQNWNFTTRYLWSCHSCGPTY